MRGFTSDSVGLRWTQPTMFLREYELHSGVDLVATMKLQGMMGGLATVEASNGSWTFKRLGWCGNRVTIRETGQAADLAEFRKNTWTAGGELTFARGAKFTAAMNFWMTSLTIGTETTGPVLRFRRRGFCLRSADVEVLAKDVPELRILVLFGWYLMLMLEQDGAAVVAVAG